MRFHSTRLFGFYSNIGRHLYIYIAKFGKFMCVCIYIERETCFMYTWKLDYVST